MFGYILLFIATIIVAYILGLTLVNVVDKRLSNISINVPKQNVTLNVEPFSNPKLKLDSSDSPDLPKSRKYNTTFKPNNAPTHYADIQQEVTDISTPEINGMDQFRDYRLRPDLFNQSSAPENVCLINHVHGNCSYGPTNYQDPSDMTSLERRAFATNYPQNLTIQDYVNWLWSNKRNPSLSREHMTNLKKIKTNKPLRYEAGVTPPPSKPTNPTTASEHFANLYSKGFNFKHSVTDRLFTDNPSTETFSGADD